MPLAIGALTPTNIMMVFTSNATPQHFYMELNSVKGKRVNNVDIFPKVLIRAKEVADNEEATKEEIEQQMRNLYFHPYIYPEIIETYLKLERKWKVITKYVERTGTTILWQ